MTGPRVDPYADLVGGAPPRLAVDPYADLVGGPSGSGVIDLSQPQTPNEKKAGRVGKLILPPVMAPRDVTALPITARQHYQPGVLERAGTQLGEFGAEAYHHPVKTAVGLVTAPAKSLLEATAGALERTDLPFGTNDQPDSLRAVPDAEYRPAIAQTVANMAFGPIENAVASRAVAKGAAPIAGKLLGLTAAGVPAGAAYTPTDPAAGAVTGGILAAILGGVHEGVARGTGAAIEAGKAGGQALRSRVGAIVAPRSAQVPVSGIPGLADAAGDVHPTLAPTPATATADPYAELTGEPSRQTVERAPAVPSAEDRGILDRAKAELAAENRRLAPDVPRAGAAASSIADAQTGQPFRAQFLRGQGGEESPYNQLGAQMPILGEARYGTADRTYAEGFGPNVTQHTAELTNPLVIDSDQQWRSLTRQAGWEYPNPFGRDPSAVAADIARLRAQVEGMGHDGVVVRIPPDDLHGKTLGKVFGSDQVIEFRPGRAAEDTGAAAPTAPETASPYADLFGERPAPKLEQGGLFGEQAATEGSRPLANAERAARAELDQLGERYDRTTDATERQQIAARMAELEKLTNRGQAIGADELARRAVAEGGVKAPHDPYADLTGDTGPDHVAEAPTPAKGGVVVDDDGVRRFESARTESGARRNPERVATSGLLDELLDLEQKRADAQARAVYEVRDDPNMHTGGIPQIAATRKGGGPSRQAKALTNLDAFDRAQSEIEAELTRRGLAGDALTERMQDHHAEREERRAVSGDFDPGNLRRSLVHDEAGQPLFTQTPEGFAEEERERQVRQSTPPPAPDRPPIELGSVKEPRAPGEIQMALARASLTLRRYEDAINKVFAPAARSEEAGRTALSIREHEGDIARRNEQAREALNGAARVFDRMPDADRLDFIDRVETGRPQATTELQGIADVMRRLLDSGRDAIRALGTGKLEHWIENYFPHLWENPEDALTFIDRVMSKRSLSGPSDFLKRRMIPTLREGIEAGLTPLTTNPVDMTLLKLREMNKYLAGQRILAELREDETATFVHATEKPPTGLVKLDDKLGTIYGPPHVEVMEGYDKLVRQKLESIMHEMGVQHIRKPNIGGSGRMGYAEGDWRIVSRSATESVVLMHEIGHALDKRLNLWDRLTDMPGTTREAIDARKQLHSELRDLADLRIEGENPDTITPGYKDYLRKRTEKIANAVHALVYMPDRMEEVAPLVKQRLTDLLKSDPVAAKMLDVKPSLVLGADTFKAPVGGIVVKGHWYVPEPVARVVNNYLSPGLRGNPFYDLYRGVGNAMNQWQLGFSAYHLGFTSVDAAVSKAALGVEQLFAGRPLEALRSAAEVPVAPITNYLRGSKVLREYLAPGTEGNELAQIVQEVVRGGGRVRQDEFYGGGAYKQFREALTRGKLIRAARTSLPALTEMSSKLVMEHIVPRQKLGVFADLMRFELSRLPKEATRDQVRAIASSVWDSVDNRMGQLVYSNLFWHRYAKDVSMAGVRSVGWNLGTIREIGGGISDLQAVPRRLSHTGLKKLGVPGDWQGAMGQEAPRTALGPGAQRFGQAHGDQIAPIIEPPLLSHRAAYVIALPLTVGLLGGVVHFLYTGEVPETLKDWFYPRTGRKNPDGTDERVQLPSYMRDIGDYSRHPVGTLVNKLHPLAGTIRDMLNNRDFYGHQIRNEDDPLVQQVKQEASYLLGQYQPFSARNAVDQWRRGQRSAAILNSVGITPAPRDVTRTEADRRMSQELGRRARGELTPEEVDHQKERRGLMDAIRGHDPSLPEKVQHAIQDNAIAPPDLGRMMTHSILPPDVGRFKRLPLDEAERVYRLATPEERQRYGPILMEKVDRARQTGRPSILPPGFLSAHQP